MEDWPFTLTTGTCVVCPLMMSVRLWFAFCDKTIPGRIRNNAGSRHAIDFLPLIWALLELDLFNDAATRPAGTGLGPIAVLLLCALALLLVSADDTDN